MTADEFLYCTRLERRRQQYPPRYRYALRALLKSFFVRSGQAGKADFPATGWVFVVITENHFKHFKPVAEALERRNAPFFVLFTHDQLFHKYGGAYAGRCLPLSHFQSRKNYQRAAGFMLRLWWRLRNGQALELANALRLAIPCFWMHHTALELFSRSRIRLVLFKADGYHANALLTAARKTGAERFVIQHGLIPQSEQLEPPAVDHYLVWSQFFKQRLEQQHPGCAIHIAGNAAYDAVFAAVKNSSRDIGGQKHPVLLALPNSGVSHTPAKQVLLLLDFLLTYEKTHPQTRFCVKPHPADQANLVHNYLRERIQDKSRWKILDRSAPIPFSEADVVVVNNSGAGMEACIWSLPIIVVAPDWESISVQQYIEAGVAEWCSTAAGFEAALAAIQSDADRYRRHCARLVEEQLAFHGEAAERMADILLNPDLVHPSYPQVAAC